MSEDLRVRPRGILKSLSHLRIDKSQITSIESRDDKAGGKADVEAAILSLAQPSGSSEPEVTEYVALKKLRFDEDTDDERVLAPLAHEVGLLNDLSHENVVKIIGFVEDTDNGVAWMVFRWEKNGNLREFVRSANWELPERVSLIDDVARGLSYLHGRYPPICHGDLKSLNILVNSDNRAFISDFGSARAIDSAAEAVVNDSNAAIRTKIEEGPSAGGSTMEPLKAEVAESGMLITVTGPAWTVRWAAPELLDGVLPSLGSDIWAFGWICWEAITGSFPFDGENDANAIRRIMEGDLPALRSDFQLNQIKMLCSLVEECWILDPNKRPPALRCRQMVSGMNLVIPVRRSGDSLATAPSGGLLRALGRIQLQNGIVTKAQEYFRKALEVFKSVGDEKGKASVLSDLGDGYRLQDDYSTAEELFIQSRDLYSKVGDDPGFAYSVMALGELYHMRSEYSKAEESFIQSRDLYSKIGDQPGFARSVKALGNVYKTRNEHSKAEESYTKSRDLFSKIGDQLGFAQSVLALGDVYRMRDEYSKAEESYIQSRDLFSKIGDQPGFAQSVKALGNVYKTRNEYSKAEESYIQARDLYSKLGNQLGFAQSVKALGDVYRVRHEYSKAKELYVQSRDLFSKLGDQLGFAQSVLALGDVYRMRNEYSEAEKSYIQSRDMFYKIGNQLGFDQSVTALEDVYRMRTEFSTTQLAIPNSHYASPLDTPVTDYAASYVTFEGLNVFQALQTLVLLSPIPGLGEAAVLVQECYRRSDRVKLRKSEIGELCEYGANVVMVINEHAQKAPQTSLEKAVNALRKALANISEVIDLWATYGRAMAFLKNDEIQAGIRQYRSDLAEVVSMLSLEQYLDLQYWDRRFQQAAEADRTVLVDIANDLATMNRKMDTMSQHFANYMPYSREDPDGSQLNRVREALFGIHNEEKTGSGLLNRELEGEIQKTGNRPVHVGTRYDIWQGVWRGEYSVALKVMRAADTRKKDTDRVNRQIDLWMSMSHPNVIRLYGVCTLDKGDNPSTYFVSPWMKNRDAVTYCKAEPDADRLRLIYDAAKGLEYLHSMSIMHGNLQGSNILVTLNGSAVLSDFTLSKVLDSETMFTESDGPPGSLRWMSPEAHDQELMTSQSDVYSWGMTALEILSLQIPFYKIKALSHLVLNITVRKVRPERADYPAPDITDPIWDLFADCWKPPDQRPTVSRILEVVGSERQRMKGWIPEAEASEDEQDVDDPAAS